jgi:drug/metabolite transporter, DME family
MWGLDGLLRKPLATQVDAGTVVLLEHVIALLVLLPRLPPAAPPSDGVNGANEPHSSR